MRLVGIRVLLVEDEAIVALLAEDILLDHGATVVGPATSVAQALSLVGTEEIDVGFLDVNLNGERSDPVAKALHDRRIPFIFATGYESPGMGSPIDVPVINKPYRSDQIAMALEAAVRGQRSPDVL